MATPEAARHHAGVRRRYTDDEHSELIGLVSPGRATVAEAASRLGVTLSTAYKWRRDAGSAATRGRRPTARLLAAPTFVRVLRSRDADAAAILVRVAGAEVEIRRGFDGELLREVVEALRGGEE